MSENYAVCVIDEEVLSTCFPGITPPPSLTEHRITKETAMKALREFPEIRIEEYDAEHVKIETPNAAYTEISFLVPHHPMESVSIGFRGGHVELIEKIMEVFALHFGSLMLYFGSGDVPKLFTRNAEQAAAENR